MAREENGSKGRYLYSIIPAEAVDKLRLDVTGIDESEVYPLVVGSLAAIVSDVERGELRPERKNLAAHSEVLRAIMDQTNVLPVAFGLIAGDERELRELISRYEGEMREQLENVSGKVEMGLRGLLRVDDAFAYFIEKFPDLREARDETFAGGEPSREEKIELGQLFSERLQEFQDRCAEAASERLQSVGQVRINDPRSEEEVINLAALVPSDGIESFTDAVEALAPSLDEKIELQVSGPWPAYNFVNLRIVSAVEEAGEQEEEEPEEAR